MIDLGFDVMAMAQPKTRADLLLLAKECSAELQNIRALFEEAFAECERQQAAETV